VEIDRVLTGIIDANQTASGGRPKENEKRKRDDAGP